MRVRPSRRRPTEPHSRARRTSARRSRDWPKRAPARATWPNRGRKATVTCSSRTTARFAWPRRPARASAARSWERFRKCSDRKPQLSERNTLSRATGGARIASRSSVCRRTSRKVAPSAAKRSDRGEPALGSFLLRRHSRIGERRLLEPAVLLDEPRVARVGQNLRELLGELLSRRLVLRIACNVLDLVRVGLQVVKLFRRTLPECVIVVRLPFRVVAIGDQPRLRGAGVHVRERDEGVVLQLLRSRSLVGGHAAGVAHRVAVRREVADVEEVFGS